MARFIQRAFPSANTVLLGGGVMVDPGDDPGPVLELPDPLDTVLTTHWHSDHAGAVHALQAAGATVGVPAGESETLAAWGPDAGRLWWLRQRMERYRVDRALQPGDTVQAAARWTVVALPGHTAAQIGLHDPAAGVLVTGDALHEADVGWLDLDADEAALDQAEATLETIARLRPRLLLPGHGRPVEDPEAALDRGRRRLRGFRAAPERIVFHAAKRIFTHALMTEDGLAEAALTPMLLGCPWFHDGARRLRIGAEEYRNLLLAEMLRSGAAAWEGGFLVPAGAYRGRGERRVSAGAAQSSPPLR